MFLAEIAGNALLGNKHFTGFALLSTWQNNPAYGYVYSFRFIRKTYLLVFPGDKQLNIDLVGL